MTTTPGTPQMGALSPQAARRIARAATSVVLVLALASAALSYVGLHLLAVQAGVHPTLAVLLPVVVDGLVVSGTLGLVYTSLTGLSARLPWLLIVIGVVASVSGNVLAAPDDLVSRLVHGAPPVVMALSLELALSVLRHRAGLPTPRQARRQRTTASPPASGCTAPVSVSSRQTSGRLSTSPRPSSRRQQVAALLAHDPAVTGALVAATLGIDPADARRHLRALRADQQPRATLALAATAGAGRA